MMWGYNYGYPMMNYGYFGGASWLHVMFIVIWALVLAAIIIAVLRAIRGGNKDWLRNGISGSSALDILKERYAKGEIDRKEFEEKKKDLSA